MFATSFQTHRRRHSMSCTERRAALQNTINALHRLQATLTAQETELQRINELLNYVQTLQSLDTPTSPEEQFNQLYYLRKWLFWVPVSLLRRDGAHTAAIVTIAHFYSTALELEPLFPDLGTSFCSALALPSLEAIIALANDIQSQQPMDSTALELASMMHFPQQAALSYRSRVLMSHSSVMPQDLPIATTISPDALTCTTVGNLSPAFAPSPLYAPTPHSTTSFSPFLEVPTSNPGFEYGTQTWGVAPSPSFPADSSMQGSRGEQAYAYGGFRGGFVNSAPIWT